MFIPKDICPVPFDQLPVNEYNALKRSCFFSSVTFRIDRYCQVIIGLAIGLCIIFSPFTFFTIPYSHLLFRFKFLLLDLIIVNTILIIMLLRLYLGWSYVMKRLLSATVFYEESGWYDGQLWIKTPEIMTKDRLIGLYEINPLLKRINYTLIITLSLFFLECFLYYLL